MLKFNSVKFEENNHPNKMPFTGVCAFVDTPTDGSPDGGGGYKFIFDKAAVKAKLDSFNMMGVNCVYDDGFWSSPEYAMTGHNTRFKIGVVEKAWLKGKEIHVQGILWKNDFPDVCFMISNAKDALGFSVEILSDKWEETEDDIVTLTDLTFTGVAIMYHDLAAFKSTQLFKEENKEDDTVNQEEIKAMLDEFKVSLMEEIKASINVVEEKVVALEAKEVPSYDDSELKTKLSDIEAKLSEQQNSEPERKTAQFADSEKKVPKNEEEFDLKAEVAKIESDHKLTVAQRMSAKLQLFNKASK